MATIEEERARRIEELVCRVDDIPDRESRDAAQKLMESILEFHGAGLERIMNIVFEAGPQGEAAIRRFANDGLVAALLLLHNLHPDDLETRVRHALGKLQGKADLIGVFEGSVRVRLSSSGCGLAESVEAAVKEAAPDAVEIIVQAAPSNGFVPLEMVGFAVPRAT